MKGICRNAEDGGKIRGGLPSAWVSESERPRSRPRAMHLVKAKTHDAVMVACLDVARRISLGRSTVQLNQVVEAHCGRTLCW